MAKPPAESTLLIPLLPSPPVTSLSLEHQVSDPTEQQQQDEEDEQEKCEQQSCVDVQVGLQAYWDW